MNQLTFEQPHHNNVHAVLSAAGSVWAGFCQSPSVLARVSPDLTDIAEISFDHESGLHDLAFDGRYVWVAHASGHFSRVDPATGEYQTYTADISTSQVPFLYCLMYSGGYLWSATYTEPARLLRIDPADGTQDEIILPEAPHCSARALVATEDEVWVGLYTVPGRIMIVDKHSLTPRALDLGEDNILCTSGVFDGRCVWLGLDTMPARVVRVDPSTHDVESFDLWPGSSCIRGMAFDGRYLWLGLYTEPGELVRFDPETAEVQRHTMPAQFDNVRGLSLEDNTLWAVTQNVRYQPSGLYGIRVKGVGER